MGDYTQALKNNLKILFVTYLFKKIPLCVYGEYAIRKKVLKFRISRLTIAQHEITVDILFLSWICLIAKKPPHATVPLS
jgi:hypothetical protein